MSDLVKNSHSVTDESGETLLVQDWAGSSGLVFTARAPGGYAVAVRANHQRARELRDYLTAQLGDDVAAFDFEAERERLIGELEKGHRAYVELKDERDRLDRFADELAGKLADAVHENGTLRGAVADEVFEAEPEVITIEDADFRASRRLAALRAAAEVKEDSTTTDLLRLSAYVLADPDGIEGLVRTNIFGGLA